MKKIDWNDSKKRVKHIRNLWKYLALANQP